MSFSGFRGQNFFLNFFCKKGIMQLFSADPIVFFKKNLKKKFDPENMKKLVFFRAAQILKSECTI